MSTYQDQSRVIVDYIIKDLNGQKPRIALVTQQNEPGKVFEASAKAATGERGVELSTIVNLPFGSTDATSQVLLLKRADPNYVIIQGNIGVAVALLRDAKKLGLKTKFIGTFSTFSEHTYMKAGDAAKTYVGVHSFNAWYDKESGIEEMQKITLKYEPGTENEIRSRFYVQGWVTAMVLAEGLRKAGQHLDAEKLVEALESIKNFDTKGLCGPISYSSSSHKGLEFIRVYTCQDFKTGKLVPITEWTKP
jgi:branched-chain amino acid transport system substrate-binding protein